MIILMRYFFFLASLWCKINIFMVHTFFIHRTSAFLLFVHTSGWGNVDTKALHMFPCFSGPVCVVYHRWT